MIGLNTASDLDGLISRFAGINAIQIVDITAIPEPSVALLGAAGLLVGLRRRWHL